MANKPWVLVVDDVHSACVLAERLLKANGYQVVTKETVEAALVELSNARIYSLVISDWMFKNQSDGLKMLEAVRKWYPNNGIGLLLWTGYPAGCVLAKDAGIPCVEKGCENKDFLEAVSMAIRGTPTAA